MSGGFDGNFNLECSNGNYGRDTFDFKLLHTLLDDKSSQNVPRESIE